MPSWASRITLEIVNVRVERLQDISHGDAIKEGIYIDKADWGNFAIPKFNTLWNSIYGPDDWNANPWVWVVEFEKTLGR